MTSKIRVKLGVFEVEFEGSEDFIKSDLKVFIESLPALNAAAGADNKLVAVNPVVANDLTTSTIAQRFKVKKGPELAIAAVARLVLVLKQASASRKEILKEMQSATAYYKKNYSANLGKILVRLVASGDLNEVGTNTFNLSPTKREAVAPLLA